MTSTPLRDEGLRAQYESLTALVGANINLPPLAEVQGTPAKGGTRVGDIEFKGEFGDNCVVFTRPDAHLGATLTVIAQGAEKPVDACIYVGDIADATVVRIRGARATVAIGACGRGAFLADIGARDGATVVVGDRTTIRGLKISARSGAVTIGRDCMFSSRVSIYCVEVHSLVAIEGTTARQIARDHACEIGDKVWIGRGAQLLSGARVGQGSVIGAGSVLAGEIPQNSAAAGNPCRTIRNDVTWSRSRDAIDPQTRKYLANTLGCTDFIDDAAAQTIESEST